MSSIKNMNGFSSPADELCVVIPHYNTPHTLSRTLASLAEQRNCALSVLVVDDASESSCEEVIQKYRQMGLKLYLHKMPQKSGTLKCRLKGMELANTPYLAFMDADDLLNGPDVYSEALKASAQKPDIIHFNTLTKNSWGIYAFDDYMAPISHSKLVKPDIFPTWLKTNCKAHTVWNKLYSRALYKAVATINHQIKINRIEDFYLCAWFFLLANSYHPVAVPVYKYNPPEQGSLEKYAARTLDCFRMYLELPEIFAARGLSEEDCLDLRRFLRLLVTINGAKMCERLCADREFGALDEKMLEKVLKYGSKDELFLALAVANGSNASKIRDVNQILINAR